MNDEMFTMFLKFIQEGSWDKASKIVLCRLTKDARIDQMMKLIKNTSMRCQRDALQTIDKIILDYRNKNLTNKKLEVIVSRLRSNNVNFKEAAFYNTVRLLMTDLGCDAWQESYAALEQIHMYTQDEKQIQSFLAELAVDVWPDKGLFGAIYG